MIWSNPLSPEQLEAINTKLHMMAYRFSKCEADRLDYVQTAYMALIDGKRKWTNPLVCAYSAMLDYYNHLATNKTVYVDTLSTDQYDIAYEEEFNYAENEVLEDKEFRSLKWLDIDITEKERQLAILYWVEGCTQDKIAKLLKMSQVTVSNRLTKIKEKIKVKFKGSFN